MVKSNLKENKKKNNATKLIKNNENTKKNEESLSRLALRRTNYAHERTILAFWRTSLSFFLFGGAIIKFFQNELLIIVGIISILFGVLLFFYSITKA